MNKGPGSDKLPFTPYKLNKMTNFDTKLIQKSYPMNIISGPEKSAWSFLRGLWDFGPSNLSILRKKEKKNNKVCVSLYFNFVVETVFLLFDSKICIIVGKNYNS